MWHLNFFCILNNPKIFSWFYQRNTEKMRMMNIYVPFDFLLYFKQHPKNFTNVSKKYRKEYSRTLTFYIKIMQKYQFTNYPMCLSIFTCTIFQKLKLVVHNFYSCAKYVLENIDMCLETLSFTSGKVLDLSGLTRCLKFSQSHRFQWLRSG